MEVNGHADHHSRRALCIAEMDAAGIDMQIVSLTAPGVEQLEAAAAISLAVETNDFVADAIKKHPARFGGFAALPIGDKS